MAKYLLRNQTVTGLPDICLPNINMPVTNGYETIIYLKHNRPAVKVLIYSMYPGHLAKGYEIAAAIELSATLFICI